MIRHERGAHDKRGVHGQGRAQGSHRASLDAAQGRRISNYRQTHGKLQVFLYKLPSCFPVFISELHLASELHLVENYVCIMDQKLRAK